MEMYLFCVSEYSELCSSECASPSKRKLFIHIHFGPFVHGISFYLDFGIQNGTDVFGEYAAKKEKYLKRKPSNRRKNTHAKYTAHTHMNCYAYLLSQI